MSLMHGRIADVLIFLSRVSYGSGTIGEEISR